jgi:uncharacterized protein (TIGR02996 family)
LTRGDDEPGLSFVVKEDPPAKGDLVAVPGLVARSLWVYPVARVERLRRPRGWRVTLGAPRDSWAPANLPPPEDGVWPDVWDALAFESDPDAWPVYADWLEDHGYADRAGAVRAAHGAG